MASSAARGAVEGSSPNAATDARSASPCSCSAVAAATTTEGGQQGLLLWHSETAKDGNHTHSELPARGRPPARLP